MVLESYRPSGYLYRVTYVLVVRNITLDIFMSSYNTGHFIKYHIVSHRYSYSPLNCPIDVTHSLLTMKVPNHVIDSLHSILMDDDGFQEALMRVTLQVASDITEDPDEQQELAMELFCRVSVS